MYWIRVAPLKHDLAGPGLTERERFKYLLAWTIASGFGTRLIHAEPTPRDYAAQGFALVLGVVTVWNAYRSNGGKDGRALLDRFLSLSWVVSLRTWIAVELVRRTLAGVAGLFGDGMLDEEAGPSNLELALVLGAGV